MKVTLAFTISAIAYAGCAQIVHVPPGTSVELALARKPEVLKMPEAPAVGQRSQPSRGRRVYAPAVEPNLPTTDSVTAAAEAYTRGRIALTEGRTDDAVTALQQAVQVDPQFTQAWQTLAMAYEKAGNGDKAKEAFRRSKNLAQH